MYLLDINFIIKHKTGLLLPLFRCDFGPSVAVNLVLSLYHYIIYIYLYFFWKQWLK